MKHPNNPPLHLTALSASELENRNVRITARLAELRERELAMAFDRLDEVAKSLGLDEEKLRSHFAKPRRKPDRAKAPRKHANPHQPDQTRSGRGKRPAWVREHLAGGGSLDELIPDGHGTTDPFR
ncbi:MAG: H-NS family nucleoid-associated regulatory protein [Candidatus Binatia bacterium]